MEWYNEPPRWNQTVDRLVVLTGPQTDFWRKTHYGFIRDSGHFCYERVTGDFVAEVEVRGQYKDLYDQAGLMVRVDEANWLKCGLEYVEGVQHASCVVTRDYSDWSVVALPAAPSSLWLRITRHGEALEVQYSLDGAKYTMLRLTYLPLGKTVQVGPMCASPDGNGFEVAFEKFALRPG